MAVADNLDTFLSTFGAVGLRAEEEIARDLSKVAREFVRNLVEKVAHCSVNAQVTGLEQSHTRAWCSTNSNSSTEDLCGVGV